MNKNLIVKLALSAVVFTVPAVSVSGETAKDGAVSKEERLKAKKAFQAAKKAEKFLAQGQSAKALPFAETAVSIDLYNLEYRSLLARAYMKEGRFKSAERTLMDVMELGKSDARTLVSIALTRIAQGKVDSAIALVDANQGVLPASDYGLALALAGETKRGISVLTDSIRADNGNARTRQNLALAYALDGRWRDSQVMAMQDMPKDVVDKRIVEWAQYTRPGAYQARIAGLLGVTPQEDAGQPVSLALNVMAGEVNVAAAQYAPIPAPLAAPVVAPMAPVAELAAVGPAPVDVPGVAPKDVPAVAAVVAVMQQLEAPLIKAPEGPAKKAQPQAVKAAMAKPVAKPAVQPAAKPAAKPVKLALADTTPAASSRPASGSHLIQLGAFSSVENAQKAWGQFTTKFGVLQDFRSASSSVVVNGKRFIRLAAMGFGNASSANAVCGQIKSKGGDCVVKTINGTVVAPVRMAAAKPKAKPVRRIASR
jgi:D-alanyl-D-alanine carboxypeptidase